jgi:hypothetical protein
MSKGLTDHWFVRFSRFGTTHLVRAQDGPRACGIASVMMTCCRMNKWTTVSEGMLSEDNVYTKYAGVSGAPYNGTTNTGGGFLVPLLNSLGIGNWVETFYGPSGVGAEIIKAATTFQLSTMPVIAHMNWANGEGHYVVIDNVFTILGTSYACVNDPWDGNIHVTSFQTGSPITYNSGTPTFSFDVWGSHFSYTPGSQATFSGFLMYCTGMDVKARLGKVFLSGNPM